MELSKEIGESLTEAVAPIGCASRNMEHVGPTSGYLTATSSALKDQSLVLWRYEISRCLFLPFNWPS